MGKKPHITYKSTNAQKSGTVFISGALVVDQWFPLRESLCAIRERISPDIKIISLDLKGVQELDTFGCWRLARFQEQLSEAGVTCRLANAKPDQQDAIRDMSEFALPSRVSHNLKAPRPDPIRALGNCALHMGEQFYKLIAFMGLVIQSIGACITKPSLFRPLSFIKYIDYTGVRALPIIGLVAILIGIVLVYQGVTQLERFGAEIFTVDLLAVSVLRELGILMTAIVVAGRSGSSFTAQIGFMKLNQEIDAMKVLGINPLQVLVVPRILALMIVMPLLTIYCDLVALAGGAYMSVQLIDLSFPQFLNQLQSAITPSTFWVGIIKAPVFAFIIGVIGCYEGLRVSGGAENVGRHTTKSVVKSIFMVIVLNAFFSVLFSILKV